MRKQIAKIVDNFLKKRQQIRIQATPRKEIFNLIRLLHPIKTEKELIRLGPEKDGGYLVPDDLEGIEACFSPGVYEVTQFEYDCYNRGMKLFLADKSIKPPEINIPKDRYRFIEKYIGATNNNNFITLDTWVKNSINNNESDLLLQMDIEGWEYFSLINVSNELLNRFRIIVIEFHNLNHLWIPAFFNFASETFKKLLETHTCVHIHPNNASAIYDFDGIEIPPLAEFTFYRNDRIKSKNFQTNFPNNLDFKNVESYADVRLPIIWYSTNL